MSSILKALKKLEDEYPRTTGVDASLPRTPGVKKTLRRWEINSGRFAPVLWGALAIVVLAATAWFLIYMRSSDKVPTPSAELPKTPLPSTSVEQAQTGSGSAPAVATRRSTGVSAAGNRRRRTARATTKARTEPAAAARTRKSGKQRKPVPPAPGKQAEVRSGADLPVLQSGLELQAVSWALDPANRIAVINGSIVREGGSIEGYSVVRIEQDEVLVRKGLSEWKLVFNLKK